MPDFSSLYNRPAGQTPKPPVLPIEVYPGIITKYEMLEQTFGQPIPGLRVHLRIIGWPEAVPESSRSQRSPDGRQIDIDLSKLPFRKDFQTPEDFNDRAWFFFDEFLRSVGLNPESSNYSDLLPQLVGQRVRVQVQQYMNQRTNEMLNQVGAVFGEQNRT